MAHPGDQRIRAILVIRRTADARQLTPRFVPFRRFRDGSDLTDVHRTLSAQARFV